MQEVLRTGIRATRRAAWGVLSRLPQRDLTRDTQHGRITFSSHDRVIGRSLFLHRHYAYPVMRRTVEVLRREGRLPAGAAGCVLDVGANVGTVCLALLRDGVFATAAAFEPEPGNYAYLRRNVEQNGLAGRVGTFACALSDRDGELFLERSAENLGDHRVRVSGDASVSGSYGEEGRQVIRVPVRTLDSLLDELPLATDQPNLVWMDVQGHEGHVLRGSGALLGRGTPVVTEFWPYGLRRAGTSDEEFGSLVAAHFRHWLNLREPEPTRRPIDSLGELYRSLQGVQSTDLLLLAD
jgi:FkbM family methyltransferase